jgi:hypothetical protein
MSRKRDPVLTVLQYFSDADLPLAEQGLTLAKQIVAKRRAASSKPAPKKATTKPANGTTAAPAPAAADPSLN